MIRNTVGEITAAMVLPDDFVEPVVGFRTVADDEGISPVNNSFRVSRKQILLFAIFSRLAISVRFFILGVSLFFSE